MGRFVPTTGLVPAISRWAPEILMLCVFVALFTPTLNAALLPTVPFFLPFLTFCAFVSLPRYGETGEVLSVKFLIATMVLMQLVLPLGFVFVTAALGFDKTLQLILLAVMSTGTVFALANFAIWFRIQPYFAISLLVITYLATPLFLVINLNFTGLMDPTLLQFSVFDFCVKVGLFLVLPFFTAQIIRHFHAPVFSPAYQSGIRLVSIALLALLAFALLTGASQQLISDPAPVWFYAKVILVQSIAIFTIMWLLFRFVWQDAAVLIATGAAVRNCGLTFLLLGSTLPSDFMIYLALAQFPIYAAPLMLKWFSPHGTA